VRILVLYVALALALTWPLARHLATHVAGTSLASFGDVWVLAWALAFQSRALVGLPHGGMFHPTPHSLFYGETGLGALPLFIGPYLATSSPELGLNVVYLGGLALTAWSLHAVTARWTTSHVAGFLAAWTFLTCPFGLWAYGPNAVNYVTLWYWPWIVYFVAEPRSGVAATLALAALVFVQGLSSVYVAAGLLGPLVVLGALACARRASRFDGARILLATAVAVAGWTVAFSPFLLVRAENPALARQTLYPFLPRFPTPLWLFRAGEPSGIAPIALAVVAAGALASLGGDDRRRTVWRSCVVWVVVGVVLATPPTVGVGEHAITTPTGLLVAAGLPLDTVRDNGRRGIAALIGLSLLVGVGWVECVAWLDRRWNRNVRARRVVDAAVVVALTVGILHGLLRPVERRGGTTATPGRFPLIASRDAHRVDSPIMDVLRQPGGPLLELPTAPGPIHHADAMYRASRHDRAILNGQDGYWPAGFVDVMALACRLPDPAAMAALRHATGVELVLVHLVPQPIGRPSGPYACPPATSGLAVDVAAQAPLDRAAWEDVAHGGRSDLVLVARDGTDLLFRVE
jgi:hypothetical protein